MAEFEVDNRMSERVLFTSLRGVFDDQSIETWARTYERASDAYRGRMHMVIADMRGLEAMRRSVATRFGEAIGYSRQRGVVLCAHLSDETVQRLQGKRLARENSPGDDVTVDVSSLEEAHAVCAATLGYLDDSAPVASARDLSAQTAW